MEGSMADYEGSWSCIERRAQTEAEALIKNVAQSQPSPGKGGVRKARKTIERRGGRNKLSRGARWEQKKEEVKVYCPLWTRPLLDSYKRVLFPMKHTATVYSFL